MSKYSDELKLKVIENVVKSLIFQVVNQFWHG